MKKRDREQFWRNVVREHAGSGLSADTFCQQRRLDPSTFDFWRQRVRTSPNRQTLPATPAHDPRSAKSPPIDRADHDRSKPHDKSQPAETPRVPSADSAVPRTARDGLCRLLESIEIKKGHPAAEATPPAVPREVPDKPKPASTAKDRSSDWIGWELRREGEERYRLTDSKAFRVRVEVDSDDEKLRIDADLVDISQGGVRLLCERHAAKGNTLTIEILPDDSTTSLAVRARVCWTTLAPKGGHWLGCSVEPRIPKNLLEQLAAGGILERRHDARRKVRISLPGRWELLPEELEVTLLNLSAGGVCLSLPKGGKPGDRIRLTLSDDLHRPTYVILTVCWQVTTDAGHIVGCTFGQRAAYAKLLELAENHRHAR